MLLAPLAQEEVATVGGVELRGVHERRHEEAVQEALVLDVDHQRRVQTPVRRRWPGAVDTLV